MIPGRMQPHTRRPRKRYQEDTKQWTGISKSPPDAQTNGQRLSMLPSRPSKDFKKTILKSDVLVVFACEGFVRRVTHASCGQHTHHLCDLRLMFRDICMWRHIYLLTESRTDMRPEILQIRIPPHHSTTAARPVAERLTHVAS